MRKTLALLAAGSAAALSLGLTATPANAAAAGTAFENSLFNVQTPGRSVTLDDANITCTAIADASGNFTAHSARNQSLNLLTVDFYSGTACSGTPVSTILPGGDHSLPSGCRGHAWCGADVGTRPLAGVGVSRGTRGG